jgi:preprotein translocase subunit SecD
VRTPKSRGAVYAYLAPLVLALTSILAAGCALPWQGEPQHTLAKDGGYRLALRASCLADLPGCDVTKGRDAALPLLARRLSDGFQIADAVVRKDGADGIVVELPGVKDEARIVPLLTYRGALAILDSGAERLVTGSDMTGKTCTTACQPGQYRIVFTGEEMYTGAVEARVDPQTGQPVVYFAFAGDARQRFANYTRDHIGQYLTIAADDRVIESATIRSEIDGPGVIQGDLTLDDAKRLAAYLKSGPLPVRLTLTADDRVTPTAK